MIDRETLRVLLSGWASGVTIVACRTTDRVVATTVTAFTSLSLDPPLVLAALGPNATVRPFLEPGARFAVNILSAEHRPLATIFADSLPVGPDPFPIDGDPVIADSLVALICTVDRVEEGGDHVIVIGRVIDGTRTSSAPLIRFDRKYYRLDTDEA